MTSTPQKPAIARVQVGANTRLEELFAAYNDLQPKADEIEKQLKAVKDAIKIELTTLAPNVTHISADSPTTGVTLVLKYSEKWGLDTARMKADAPQLYVTFAKKSGSWALSRSTA